MRVVVLRKFHAGTTIPARTFIRTPKRMRAYILSGEWEEEGVIYEAGTFFKFAPRGERQHGPHFARTEVISLTTSFDGPLTVV